MRDAFRSLGHDAWSCDLEPSEDSTYHMQCDVRDILKDGWDLAVFHPPCTYLANSSAKHLYIEKRKENGKDPERWLAMVEGAVFFQWLWRADIPHVAVENPIMLGHAKKIIGSEQTQTIQPYQFGHREQKATCLWLRNLPKLVPTKIMDPPYKQAVHLMGPSPDRWKKRSVTYQGIADAMAQQWSEHVIHAAQQVPLGHAPQHSHLDLADGVAH